MAKIPDSLSERIKELKREASQYGLEAQVRIVRKYIFQEIEGIPAESYEQYDAYRVWCPDIKTRIMVIVPKNMSWKSTLVLFRQTGKYLWGGNPKIHLTELLDKNHKFQTTNGDHLTSFELDFNSQNVLHLVFLESAESGIVTIYKRV